MLDRNRKQALLDAASQEFAAKGFSGARVNAIAEAAGVNKQLVFYYFGSKRGLYQAVIEGPSAPRVEADAPGHRPATDELRAVCRRILAWFAEHPQARCALFDPATETAMARQTVAQLEQPVRAVISAGQGLGYFRDAADPARLARQAVVLCAGWFALRGTAEAREAWVDGVVDTLLRALAW